MLRLISFPLAPGIGTYDNEIDDITIKATVGSVKAVKGDGAKKSIGVGRGGKVGKVTIEPGAKVVQELISSLNNRTGSDESFVHIGTVSHFLTFSPSHHHPTPITQHPTSPCTRSFRVPSVLPSEC